MSNPESHGPYRGEGETVYATGPEQTQPSEDNIGGPKYQDREWLHYQYHILGKTQEDIAAETDIGRSGIAYWMEKLDVATRSHDEWLSKASRPDGLWRNENWLRKEYVDLEKSTCQIADEQNTYDSIIHKWLVKFGIERREKGDPTSDYRDKEWLELKYWEELKSVSEMADELDCASSTIGFWMDHYDIPRRTTSESVKLYRNKNKKVEKRVDGKKREYVVKDEETGRPIIDASWQYFHERPVKQ